MQADTFPDPKRGWSKRFKQFVFVVFLEFVAEMIGIRRAEFIEFLKQMGDDDWKKKGSVLPHGRSDWGGLLECRPLTGYGIPHESTKYIERVKKDLLPRIPKKMIQSVYKLYFVYSGINDRCVYTNVVYNICCNPRNAKSR